jgi:predicted flap endonuclease-1-like 5' DNA nuclease
MRRTWPLRLIKEVLMPGLKDIEGIGASYAEKLDKAGLATTDALLSAGSAPKGRADLAATTGISETLILRWVNMSDLFRIKGVGEQYSDLLEAAGVDTVVELAQRKPENLQARMTEVNEERKMVRRVPTLSEVSDWVEQAKVLPRMVSY